MLRARTAMILAGLLLLSAMPLTHAAEGRAVSCDNIDMGTMPDPILVDDQACAQIALGQLEPGTVVEFDLSADAPFDFLVFRANALPVYANEQSYRSPTFWAEDTVFEDLSGDARWHWMTPTDESASNWFVVLDNMDHAGDDDAGAQGGSQVSISLDISFPNPNAWTLHDGLVSLGVNSHRKIIDEESLRLDEGSQVSIAAIPMQGTPDIFLLTENQRLSYLDGNAPEFRVTGADLLSINAEDSVVWTVDAAHADQPLYLYADNEVGPNGGGDGSEPAVFTVIITLLPLLDATISSADPQTIDVGQTITLSANNTPNLSNQVDESAYEWDLDDDGTFERVDDWSSTSFDAPGNYSLGLRAHGVDGRVDTVSTTITVVDMTDPNAAVFGGAAIVRGFGETFTLTSASTDNHVIDREEWYVGSQIQQSNPGTGNDFNHAFNLSGAYNVTLIAFDPAGRSSSTTVMVTVRDVTPPDMQMVSGPIAVMAGETHSWTVIAVDSQSELLIWTWDFDRATDSDQDGDSTNDAQATGALVSWAFDSPGDYSITCTVTNDEGLSSSRELLVHVEAEPAETSGVSGVVTWIVSILFLLGIAGGGVFLFMRHQRTQAENELQQLEAARQAEAAQEAAREPDHQEQLAMFQQRGGGGGGGGFQRGGGADEMAAIAGVGQGYATQAAPVVQRVASTSDDALLAAFEEPEPAPEPVAEPEPEPTPAQTPQPAAAKPSKASVLSSGIELPAVLHEAVKREAPTPEPAPAAPTTSEVTGSCAACGQRFAVDMPASIEVAQIDCPKCGTRGTVRR